MTEIVAIGRSTGGKPVNLTQLQAELATAGVQTDGLGMHDDLVYAYDPSGEAMDFPSEQVAAVDAVIASHAAMRDKTDAEYSTEFQNPATTPARKQEIRDIMAGLLPREQVPMT
jgi:hypothetical protein